MGSSESKSAEVKEAYTENGALSYATTKDARIDLFFQALRNTEEDVLLKFIEDSWKIDSLDTLKIMFYTRDCRGGKGERKPFVIFYKWLLQNHLSTAEKNAEYIPQFGYYKDLLQIFAGGDYQKFMVKFYCTQLRLDQKSEGSISLAGKYAPSEGKVFDRKFKIVRNFRKELQMSPKEYREMLVELRRKLDIVETKMSSNNFCAIDYGKVPSRATVLYKDSFAKNDNERYRMYLESVKKGEAKINTGHILPGDLAKNYLGHNENVVKQDVEPIQANEVMWSEMKKKFGEKREGGNNFLCILDLSGSMYQHNVEHHCIGLGCMLTSTNPDESLRNKFLVFSDEAILYELQGEGLYENMKGISDLPIGYSTNFQSVFDLVLKMENIPEYLLCLSDVCVNEAEPSNKRTNFQVIQDRFNEAGRTMPKLVFWNLRGNIDFPASENDNVILISGFSTDVANLILQGELPSPYHIVRKAIDNERYNLLKL